MFRWIVLIACVLAAAVGLAVGVMNPEPVRATLPGLEFEMALGSLLVIVFIAGVLVGSLLFLFFFHLPSRMIRRGSGSVSTRARLPDQNA
ncbi:MAG: hypothetical protein ACNA7J_05295 [Wenzhouxiangella sp.]